MEKIISCLNSGGEAFVNFALPMFIQSGILIIIVFGLDLILRKKVRAVVRYAIWMLVLIKLVLPPSFTAPTGLGYWVGMNMSAITPQNETKPPKSQVAYSSEQLPTTLPSAPGTAPSVLSDVEFETKPLPQTTPIDSIASSPTVIPATALHWQAVVFLIWAVGVMTMSLLLLQRFVFVKGLIRQSERADESLQDILSQYGQQVGIRSRIEVKLSPNATSPSVCGLFRPVILIPQGLSATLSHSQVKAVLLHELAHIKRGDMWISFFQTIMQIVYFYHPLLWWANAMIRKVREQAVDETVLVAMGEQAAFYPDTLLNISKLIFHRPALSLRLIGVVESKSTLKSRIKHILDRPLPTTAKLGLPCFTAIIIAGAILLPMTRAARYSQNTDNFNSSSSSNVQTMTSNLRPGRTSRQPIPVQPGVIQHVVTQLKPIVPSGTIVEVDSTSSGTIQSVIDSARFGDMILIKNGMYKESLTLKDGIILQGEDIDKVIIQGDMRIGPVLKIDNCETVQVSQLTLRHFNQISDGIESHGNWPVVQIENSGASMDHLVVCDSSSDGIRIHNDRVHLNHVLITDSHVYNNLSAGILILGNGNVELKNNTCIDNKTNGIYFKDFTDGIVAGNTCKSNSYNGISITDNATVEVSANTCSLNQYAGIWYDSNSSFTVNDNHCLENGTSGISIKNQIIVEVRRNNCHRNTINGIYLMNGVSGIVNENICSENKWHGISIENNCVPRLDNNECFKNEKCGIYDDGGMLGYNKIYDNNEFCQQEIHMFLRSEDYDELEKLASQIRNEKRRFANGNWELSYFYSAFEIGYGSRPFEDNIDYCRKWISKYPTSITPRIALAISFYWQGWHIRGHGYANAVSPTDWKPFRDSLSKALDELKEAEKLNINDPALYGTWIDVARGLHNIDDIEMAFKKGCAIEPTYDSLYYAHGFSYLPKWYGKPGQYEQLAAEAAEQTKNEIGQSLYFLLACKMTRQVKNVNEFSQTGFDYNRIKQGKNDYEKQFPDFLDIKTSNRLCFMACAAGNKEDARDYFLDIGDHWDEKVWRTVETFEKYKEWARNKNEP